MTPPIGRIALTRYLAALIGSQVAFGTALNLIELAGLKTPSSLGIVGGLIGTMVAAHWFGFSRPFAGIRPAAGG